MTGVTQGSLIATLAVTVFLSLAAVDQPGARLEPLRPRVAVFES
jgi:hypothetical protein